MVSLINGIDIFDKNKIKDLSYRKLAYHRCPTCLIALSKDANLVCLSTPCPKCGAKDEMREDFLNFNASASKLFSKIKDFFISDEKEMAVILFCTLFEVLVDNFFRCFFESKNIPYEILDFLQEEVTISTKVNRMFKKLVGVKFKDAIKSTEYKDFYANWNNIKDKRNNFIHGSSYVIGDSDCKLAWKLTVNSFGLFAFLNNEYCLRTTI